MNTIYKLVSYGTSHGQEVSFVIDKLCSDLSSELKSECLMTNFHHVVLTDQSVHGVS